MFHLKSIAFTDTYWRHNEVLWSLKEPHGELIEGQEKEEYLTFPDML